MVESQAVVRRWVPLLGGVLGSTVCGFLLYAWSVFIAPLNAEFGWTRSEISLAFAIICLVFGLTAFPAGKLSDRYGPRPVVFAGAVLIGMGFFAAGFSQTKIQLYLTYGVIAGLGGGLIYIPPIATAPKWWPDRKALATGLTVVGLGLGSFIMAPLATWFIEHPEMGWRYVFWYVGIGMGMAGILSGLCLFVPPKGWKPAGWEPPQPAAGAKATRDYTHEETIRTPQFWQLYGAYFCGAFAGLMVIGHIVGHGIESGLDPMIAAFASSGVALTNAAVRPLIGQVADKIGIKTSFIIIMALQVVAMALLYPAGGVGPALIAVAVVIGWNYGALFTLFPATTLWFYGSKAQGANYGLLFTSYGLAGFAGSYAGGYLADLTGTYFAPFVTAAVIVSIGTFLVTITKPPSPKEA